MFSISLILVFILTILIIKCVTCEKVGVDEIIKSDLKLFLIKLVPERKKNFKDLIYRKKFFFFCRIYNNHNMSLDKYTLQVVRNYFFKRKHANS